MGSTHRRKQLAHFTASRESREISSLGSHVDSPKQEFVSGSCSYREIDSNLKIAHCNTLRLEFNDKHKLKEQKMTPKIP